MASNNILIWFHAFTLCILGHVTWDYGSLLEQQLRHMLLSRSSDAEPSYYVLAFV